MMQGLFRVHTPSEKNLTEAVNADKSGMYNTDISRRHGIG